MTNGPDLTRSDDIERELFRKYSIALRLWARRFNTAEIAAHLKEPEHIVCRWIWPWRELSRGGVETDKERASNETSNNFLVGKMRR